MRVVMHRLASLAACVVAVVAGCAGAQTPGPQAPRVARDYFPLQRNAAWSFTSVDMDRGGIPGLVTMRVVRDDGAGGYYMQQGPGAPALYEFAEGGLTRNGELVLSNPIARGTTWRGHGGDTYTIRHVGLTRTVTAGTFHDVIEVVRVAPDATLTNGTEFRETFFYAPNVGPIEGIVPVLVGPRDARRFRLTLRGYTLNGDL